MENIQQEGAATIPEFETSDDQPVTVVVLTGEKWKVRPFPLSGCSRRVAYTCLHVLEDHAPGIFRKDLEPTYQVCRERYAALYIFAKKLKGTTIEGLFAFHNSSHLF